MAHILGWDKRQVNEGNSGGLLLATGLTENNKERQPRDQHGPDDTASKRRNQQSEDGNRDEDAKSNFPDRSNPPFRIGLLRTGLEDRQQRRVWGRQPSGRGVCHRNEGLVNDP